MYEKEAEQLQTIIDDSKELYFSEVQVSLQRVIFRISEVRMDYTGRSISIHQNRL